MRITNKTGINLPLAVWLLHDTYDYIRGVDNYMSATTLMKPLRQIVLPHRIPPEQLSQDVDDFTSRKLGHAIHDSIEKAWLEDHVGSMRKMGYPEDLIARVKVNPTDEERRASNEMIPVYLEQRELREITVDGITYTIGGKFDLVADGIVQDFKSTSAWGWAKDTKDDGYRQQMSIYRWLDAGRSLRRITEDYGKINFIFTDWAKGMAKTQASYPDQRVKTKDIALASVAETETWIIAKLRQIQKYWDAPESEIPECTDEELWRSPPVYKYFSDPTKANQPGARSSKNFDDAMSAKNYLAEKGGRGIIITQPGEVKACGYCPAFEGCTQKDRYL